MLGWCNCNTVLSFQNRVYFTLPTSLPKPKSRNAMRPLLNNAACKTHHSYTEKQCTCPTASATSTKRVTHKTVDKPTAMHSMAVQPPDQTTHHTTWQQPPWPDLYHRVPCITVAVLPSTPVIPQNVSTVLSCAAIRQTGRPGHALPAACVRGQRLCWCHVRLKQRVL